MLPFYRNQNLRDSISEVTEMSNFDEISVMTELPVARFLLISKK